MELQIHQEASPRNNSLNEIAELRQFSGPPAEFWPRLLAAIGHLLGAQSVMLLSRTPAGEWRRMVTWPTSASSIAQAGFAARAATLAEKSKERHSLHEPGDEGQSFLATRFPLPPGNPVSVAAILFTQPVNVGEADLRLQLVADIPAHYLMQRLIEHGDGNAPHALRTMDLMLQLNDSERFLEAAMLLCNEVATHFGCDRVALGWQKDAYVEVVAVSHIERFDSKMEAVRELGLVMDECRDQDCDIAWPSAEDGVIDRDHANYARTQGLAALVSIPLRQRQQPVAVLTCARQTPFSPAELRALRILADQAVSRLCTLKDKERGPWEQLTTATRKGMANIVGTEHTLTKVATGIGLSFALWLTFGTWDYRIEAPFIVRGEQVAFVSAPFDGYIHRISRKLGDTVQKGDEVVSLKTDELRQREAEAAAERSRYLREADKARAGNALAEMRIASALAAQAEARLNEARQLLSSANISAPITGVMVEGDLDRMPNAPVKRSDVLFKVASLKNLHLELEVDERDIHLIRQDASGEIAFVGQPENTFKIKVASINPATDVQKNKNSFIAKASPLSGEMQTWWRPGMSGIAKIEAGERPVWWVLLHRTIDYLRLQFWL